MSWVTMEELVDTLAQTPAPAPLSEPLRAAASACGEWLATDEAHAMMADDPYWPKWNSPWWRMTLLWEMGLVEAIPETALRALASSIDERMLHYFPIREEETPPGLDPFRDVMCHCGLGTVGQLLMARGMDLDREIPWARQWILRYQLPDGGMNCDEAVYVRDTPRSSVVSTLPPAELMVGLADDGPAERRFVASAVDYLLARQLFRSVSRSMAVIDESWLQPHAPRFYGYDILRGVEFVAAASTRLERAVPIAAVQEALTLLATWFARPTPQPIDFSLDTRTLRRGADGQWHRGQPAADFPLLDQVRKPEVAMHRLRERWRKALELLIPRLVSASTFPTGT